MYKTQTPATDWYFVHPNAVEGHPPIVHQIVVWAQKENGETIGLIAAGERYQVEKEMKTPHLVSVPSVVGRYIHLSELTKQEREQASKRGQLDIARV
ncbi:hypothetical protein [Paraburkholderia tropica]|uniref:hypothetical protein n=1 Tax=Paraburkholderia tropica TaxID=92647 RepID=UPI002AB5FC1F|nr:hypothetical protein [Paraburkholderia tropica]